MPRDKEFDPWAQTGGLADDVDFEIKDAFFEFDSEYQDGEVPLLKLVGLQTDEDGEVTEEELRYGTGKGWTIKDKGKTAARAEGKDKGFHKQTAYGLFCVEAAKVAPELRKKNPRDASIWKGLTFHMERKAHNYGGEIGEIERLMPTELLKKGKSSGSSKSSSKASESEASSDGNEYGLDDDLYVQLVDLAKEVKSDDGDHDDFLKAAFKLEEVDGNRKVEKIVMDDSDESLFATA